MTGLWTSALPPLLGLAPVLLFLGGLVLLDSYKLVSLGTVLWSIGAGVAAALGSLFLNGLTLDALGWPLATFSRYASPVIEELAKSVWVVFLIRRARVGFGVDAAIHGFAVGAGFALLENAHYLWTLESPSLVLWVVRGLGTATMHGSTTAIFAIVSKTRSDRGARRFAAYSPGLALAIGIHSGFNHFVLPPLASTLLLLAVLPALVLVAYQRSESVTRHWLGTGFDADVEVLSILESGEMRETPIGGYLESLRERFDPVVVADMFCFLQVHHELAVRAKGVLLARESGLEVPVGEGIRAKLRELEFLEGSIGRTGKFALAPFLGSSRRDLWQIYTLER